MAGQKFINVDANGDLTEVLSTQTGGAGSEDKIIALDNTGRLSQSMMPLGVGSEMVVMPSDEALTAGELVSIFDDLGTVKARKADATSVSKKAVGFCKSDNGDGTFDIYMEGTISGLSGLIPGTTYFLSDITAGDITTTPPTTAGYIVQKVGTAINTTELTFETGQIIVRA